MTYTRYPHLGTMDGLAWLVRRNRPAETSDVIPETRYAKTTDDVHIAYQVLGDGPTDLVFVPGFVFNVEQLWAWPQAAKFARRLAEFSRLIVFDRRGTGLSDHIVQSDRQLTLEARMDDVRAVMDAAGSDRATLLGFEMAFAVAAMFAATYPDRTDGLIAFGAAAAWRWAPDYPWAWSDEQWDAYLADIDTGWGTPEFAERDGRIVWPDVDDPQWFAQYAAIMRRSVGPGDAAAFLRVDIDTDARGILSAIRLPTLIVHRKGDKSEPIGQARYIADHIAGATLIELPGNNHGWMSPDQEEALEEIEQFLLQLRREEAEIDRVLATVMFTDIVGSTARAAELGGVKWKELLLRHHKVIRGLLLRYRGTEVDTAGDGFFATFDGPARAIRCALAASRAVRDLGIEIRIGVHTGECELIDQKVGGIAVSIGARVAALAAAGEVLVSSTVKDLVAGSGLVFEDRGMHELGGVPGEWRLHAVVRG